MIQIIDKLPDNNLEKDFFWKTAFKLRELLQGLYTKKRGEAIKVLELSEKYPLSDETIIGVCMHEYDIRPIENILFMNYGDKHDIPPKTVIFMNADEQYRIPREVDNPNVIKIFKQYCPDHPKLFPLPLGLPNGFGEKIIPYNKRGFDIVFIGQYAENRRDIYNLVPQFQRMDIKSFIGWTNGFNRGISRSAYADIIRDSKIALCPPGTASTETFRLYEAAQAGCIIITCMHPNNWIYEGVPFFQYRDANEIPQIISTVLSSPQQERMSERVVEWNKTVWSPVPVAERLFKELR